jgi:drug/metabolite transporter (DMT)-like permease
VVVTVLAAQVIGLAATAILVMVVPEAVPPSATLLWAAAAGASGAIGIGFFYYALAGGTMGLVAPLTALIGAAIPSIVGLLSGDLATPPILAGLALALTAVVLISIPDAPQVLPEAGVQPRGRARELLLILAAGLGFAGFFLGVDQAHLAGGGTLWPLLGVRVGGVAVAGLAFTAVLVRGGGDTLRVRRRAVVPLLLAAAGDLGGNLFYILANESGPLAVAVVLSSLYPVVTAMLARVFLRERLTRLRLLGVVAAIVGIVLIAVG